MLFSCLLLIVFSSIFISKDVEQSKDKQEDTVLYEEQKSRTGLSEEDMQESSVPQVEKDIDRSQVLAESSVPQKKRGSIILVLDDGGHNISQLQPFLNLPFPLTIAVLPALAYTKETASLTRKAGKEVMLHQPMQAINLSVDPGPSAILPNMTEAEIRAIYKKMFPRLLPL